jgi:CRP-like cAMP-binding protein
MRWDFGMSANQTAAKRTRPHFAILEGFDEAERDRVLAALPRCDFAQGETVLAEGTENAAMLLVEEGELAMSRMSGAGSFPIGRLGPGDCFGEISALGCGRTTAVLTAETAGTVLTLKAEQLPERARAQVMLNVAKITASRMAGALEKLQARHEAGAAAMRTQLASAVFAARMLAGLSVYVLMLPLNLFLKDYVPTVSLISFFLIALFFGIAWTFITRVSSGFSDYGMTTERVGWRSLRGVALTVPVLAVVLLGKYLWVRAQGSGAVFEPMRALAGIEGAHAGHWAAVVAGYAILSYAQEFVRCAAQGSLAVYYRAGGLADGYRSLLVSTGVFAAMHVHLGAGFALMTLVAGLFWGLMYRREKSYWGVAASHAVAGVWTVFIVGVPV